GLAVVLAVPLAIPLTDGMTAAYPWIESNLGVVLTAIAAALVFTEPTRSARFGAGLSLAASGLLGVATLDLSPGGPLPAGGMLAPLFAGLFGAPVLLSAMGGNGVPPQDDPAVLEERRSVLRVAGLGTLAGAVVGYLPGVSSAIAATLVLLSVPASRGSRGFVVATSGVNTATAVFALFAFVALDQPRTGVLVAVDSVGTPVSLPLFLVSIAVAAAVGFVLVLVIGDRYLRTVGRLDNRRLSVGVIAALVVLVWGFTGWLGVVVFVVATAVGLVPPWAGARRVSLMGVLLVPLAL
ncbi:hypothetical protein GJ629_11305, partial [Halapricum sp. CBA1109]|uniref:tripartite tricarboxylate transporter permease n=1 Tax=Halapricum sp. CBA1109 TaxID=2668068 RepID=UPI0012FBF01D